MQTPPIRRLDTPAQRPLWALILLTRVRRGLPIETARCQVGSLCSTDTIHRYERMDPDWAADLMDAQEGVHSGRVLIDDLQLARASAADEEVRRHELAMTADPKYAHPYMRLGKEATGRIGSGLVHGGGPVAIQVNVYPEGYSARVRRAGLGEGTEEASQVPALPRDTSIPALTPAREGRQKGRRPRG